MNSQVTHFSLLLKVSTVAKIQTCYGRHMMQTSPTRLVPARLAWFIQELPAILIPLLLMLTSHKPYSVGKMLLLGTFCLRSVDRVHMRSG
uniref:Uncharacterized protein n=1 Tax=Hippocampus comes TaxID=109280 RepID=A0A3Q2YW68_HIPCM